MSNLKLSHDAYGLIFKEILIEGLRESLKIALLSIASFKQKFSPSKEYEATKKLLLKLIKSKDENYKFFRKKLVSKNSFYIISIVKIKRSSLF